jgi:photosystem II stability/assembly factor-like uncharacterized protein
MTLAWALALAAPLLSQTLRQGDRPIQVRAQCSFETVQALSLPCSSTEPCPLYLELADVATVGNRLVLTGNIHTGAATLESVLLVSDDAGVSWTEGFSRIPGAVLDQIQFLDFESGWVSGHLLQGLPRDAFLLVTTDGGRTWRRRPISGESRTGVVEQFWFDSRSHGMLTVDRVRAVEGGFRYEIWESMTGGDSWNVRQVNQEPLSIKRPERDRLWRIRTDSRAKANQIERRDGNRWVAVGNFAIAAGECKPAELERSEEPPSHVDSDSPAQPETPAETPPRTRPTKPPSLRKSPP